MIDQEKIIARVLEGETEMFRLLVELYNERIFILARGFVHQVQDAEDLTQETFLNAFLALGDFKGKSEFSTWLYRIGINTIYSYLRKKQRRSVITYYETFVNNISEQFHSNKNDTPHKILTTKQTEEIIYRAIDKLPPNQRTALILSRLDGLSQKEIAEVMSLSVHAVESLLQRGKKQLKIKLIPIINEHNIK